MARKRTTDGVKGKREPPPNSTASLIRKIPRPVQDLSRGAYDGRLHEPDCRQVQTLESHRYKRKVKCTCKRKEYRKVR